MTDVCHAVIHTPEKLSLAFPFPLSLRLINHRFELGKNIMSVLGCLIELTRKLLQFFWGQINTLVHEVHSVSLLA
ncbi:hypothetical protein D3C75_1336300 [compost metagenome]